MRKGLFLCFLLSAFAHGNQFLSCLIQLQGENPKSSVSTLQTSPYTYDGQEYQLPPKVIQIADRIASQVDVPMHVRRKRLLTLESLFGQRKTTQATLPPEFVADLNKVLAEKGENAPQVEGSEVAIVVHQQSTLQDSTAEFLKGKTPLSGVPVITLASPAFTLQSDALLGASTLLQLSEAGELTRVPNGVNRFHLMGGYCEQCLSLTTNSILRAKKTEDSTEPLTIYIYASKTYTVGQNGEVPTVATALLRLEKRIDDVLSTRALKRALSPDARIGKAELTETDKGTAYRIPIQDPEITRPINIFILAQ